MKKLVKELVQAICDRFTEFNDKRAIMCAYKLAKQRIVDKYEIINSAGIENTQWLEMEMEHEIHQLAAEFYPHSLWAEGIKVP